MRATTGERRLGLSLSVLGALFFAVGIIFSKELTDGDIPVPMILAVRFGLAAAVLASVTALAGQFVEDQDTLAAALTAGRNWLRGRVGALFPWTGAGQCDGHHADLLLLPGHRGHVQRRGGQGAGVDTAIRGPAGDKR